MILSPCIDVEFKRFVGSVVFIGKFIEQLQFGNIGKLVSFPIVCVLTAIALSARTNTKENITLGLMFFFLNSKLGLGNFGFQ